MSVEAGRSDLDGRGLARALRGRLAEIERELSAVHELIEEKERLEAALARLGELDAPQRRSNGGTRTARPVGRRSRRPRGQSRELALSFMAELGRPATATEVSNGTGLSRGTVATLLSTLAKTGDVEKRERGYALPDPGSSPGGSEGR